MKTRMNSYPLCKTLPDVDDAIFELEAGTHQDNDDILSSFYNNYLIDSGAEYLPEIKELLGTLYRERYYTKVIATSRDNASLSLQSIILRSSSYFGELIRNRAKQVLDDLKLHGSKTTTKVAVDTTAEIIDDESTDNVISKESDSGKTQFNANLLDDNYLSKAVRQILNNDSRRREILTKGQADDNYSEVIRAIDAEDFVKIETHMKMIMQLWIEHIENQILTY